MLLLLLLLGGWWFAGTHRCHKCDKFHKPSEAEAVAAVTAAAASHDWREAMDVASNQLYYYNTKTLETTWTRPEVMGPAPSATGWCVTHGAHSGVACWLLAAGCWLLAAGFEQIVAMVHMCACVSKVVSVLPRLGPVQNQALPPPPSHLPSHRFGRGAAGNDAQAAYAAQNAEYLKRPARIQFIHDLKSRGRLEGANEYNIWCVGVDWGFATPT